MFITLDPERDGQATIKRHLEPYSPEFIGLTGTRAQLEPFYDDFDVFKTNAGETRTRFGYLMSHSVFIYMLDREGFVRTTYTFQDGPEALAHDLRLFLDSAPQERAQALRR